MITFRKTTFTRKNNGVISFVQMKGVIGILAWVTPGNMHLARRQINHHGVDCFLPIQLLAINGMVTNRVGEIDMVFLDILKGLDRMLIRLAQQPQGAVILNPGRY